MTDGRSPRLTAATLKAQPRQPMWTPRYAENGGGFAPERPLTAGEIERLSAALIVVRPVAVPAAGTLAFDALRALLLDPAYQLK